MKNLVEVAGEIQEFCSTRGWKFCFIGGLTVQHWGEPRMTLDVDLTLLTGFGGEEEWVDALLENWEGRIENARDFALLNRVLLLKSNSGIGIDVSLGALEFEEAATERAIEVEVLPGKTLRLCTPEDLLVMKAFADRPRDWEDIKGILARQTGAQLDWDFIKTQLTPLAEAKGQPELLTRLLALGERAGD